MKEVMKIRLLTTNDVKEFVKTAISCPCQVDLYHGRYIVDAKSIMGIFSLDLSENISVRVPMTVDDEIVKELFQKWEV